MRLIGAAVAFSWLVIVGAEAVHATSNTGPASLRTDSSSVAPSDSTPVSTVEEVQKLEVGFVKQGDQLPVGSHFPRPSRIVIYWKPLDVDLTRWVEKELPLWTFPPESDYDSTSLWDHVNSRDWWPPWAARGDFNGDGVWDYVAVLVQRDRNAKPASSAGDPMILVLHSADSGLLRVPYPNTPIEEMPSHGIAQFVGCVSTDLDCDSVVSPQDSANLPRDAILLYNDRASSSWIWTGERYELCVHGAR